MFSRENRFIENIPTTEAASKVFTAVKVVSGTN